MVDDLKSIYSSHDAQKMIYNDNADMTSHLLVGSFTFECRIMHYILCRVLLPHSINLAQAPKDDLIFFCGPFKSVVKWTEIIFSDAVCIRDYG